MVSTRQTNFSAGELSPFLWGRTDLDLFSKGLKTCRNFFPSRHGPAFSRPGTTYMRATKAGGEEKIRLVPFIYSDSISYVLELGHLYMRFHTYGQTVESSPGVPLEIVTPYPHSDLPELQWAQVGAVMTLTHRNHPPQELRRSTAGTWTISPVTYLKSLPAWIALPGSSPTHEPALVVQQSSIGTFSTPAGFVAETGAVTIADYPAMPWKWKISAVIEDKNTGLVFESAAWNIAFRYAGTSTASTTALNGTEKFHLHTSIPMLIRRGATVTGYVYPTLSSDYSILAYNYYRGTGQVFGFVGSSTENDFVDDGREPNYTLQPPIATNPFELLNGTYDYPAAVTFFQNRRVFAGTAQRPEYVFASAPGEYHNFDERILPSPDQALEFALGTTKFERIRAMANTKSAIIIGTDSAMWSFSGQDGPLAPDKVNADVEDNVGALSLPLLSIDNTILWVRAKGRGVRALLPDQFNGFRGADISLQSQHLFVGGEVPATGQASEPLSYGRTRQIVDWCYAEDPWGLVWAVRQDGALLSLTYQPGGGALAWARHDFEAQDGGAAGFVRAVCSVPEGDEDAVYLVVQRDGGGSAGSYYLERMNSRIQNDSPEDDACVDSCLRFQGAPTLTLTGLSHLEGREVYAVAVGNEPMGPLLVTGGQVTLPRLPETNTYNALFGGGVGQDEVVMFVGLPYTCDLELLDVIGPEARLKQKKVMAVGFEVHKSRGFYTGQDFDNLTEWRQRRVSNSYGATTQDTEVAKMQVRGTYDLFSRACLRQSLPLPVTVLGIVRELDIGG